MKAWKGMPMSFLRRSAACALLTIFAAVPSAVGASPITAADAWIRETLPGKTVTAAFVKLTNGGPAADELVGATSPAVRSIELHHMATDAAGMMTMERVPSIALPKGATTTLAPGGLHLMLFGTKGELRAGAKVRLRLTFAHAQPLAVDFEVRPVTDAPAHEHEHAH